MRLPAGTSVSDHRGEEVPGAGDRPAGQHHPCSPAHRVVHERLEALALSLGDDRPDLAPAELAAAEPQPPRPSASRRMNSSATSWWTRNRFAAVHAWPALRDLLPTPAATASSRSASREDQKGRLAAELTGHAQERRPRPSRQMATEGRRAGEGELAKAGVGEQGVGRVRARADDHIENTGRQTGLGDQPRAEEAGERRPVAHAQDHRTPGGQCGRHTSCGDGEREVPGGDHEAGANGASADEHEALAIRRRLRAPADPHRLLRVPVEVLGGEGDLLAALRQRLAAVERQQGRDALGLHPQPLGRLA